VSSNPARQASRIGKHVVSQIGGFVLAVVMVQHGAARCRQRPYGD
jgi:hypothetical protein